jgi:hypothetical protein
MRRFALIMVTCLCVVAGFSAFVPPVAAQTVPTPTFSVTVVGETNGTRQQFARNLILVPEVPIKLIVTFHNNDTMQHSFTINDVNGTIQIDSKLLNPGANVTLNFTVLSMTLIAYNGTQFRPEVAPGGGILFYCIPHRSSGMTGRIALAGAPTAGQPAEKGILLRAYWIGIIGIAAMLLWTIISYFLIKSSSRHFTDHREHVRKGLP